MFTLVDTFPEFKKYFQNNLDKSIEEKIIIWKEKYISQYPELKQKCINEYEKNDYKWKEIARKMVFNRTAKDFPKMNIAYNNIKEILSQIESNIEINLDIVNVIYCGLGNGAGWVTKYKNKAAVLYGIEKIAELNWHKKEKLEALIAHELCHVIHFEIRGKDFLSDSFEKNNYYKGIWRLYEEGFAQYFQHALLDKKVYSRGKKWIDDCHKNENKLKKIYLKKLHNEGVNDFFGDWFNVLGISDVGYYLGEKYISKLNKDYSMEEIAKLDAEIIEESVLDFLQGLNY